MFYSLQSIKVLCPNNILHLHFLNDQQLIKRRLYLRTVIYHENMASI
jgi:hypothetical protein